MLLLHLFEIILLFLFCILNIINLFLARFFSLTDSILLFLESLLFFGFLLSLFSILFCLDFGQFFYDTGVELLRQLNKINNSLPLLTIMLLTTFFILFFHPSFFVPILRVFCVILIMLRKLSPGLKVVPKFVKLVHLVHGRVFVAEVWDRFYRREAGVVLETRRKLLVKIDIGNIVFFRYRVIER